MKIILDYRGIFEVPSMGVLRFEYPRHYKEYQEGGKTGVQRRIIVKNDGMPDQAYSWVDVSPKYIAK